MVKCSNKLSSETPHSHYISKRKLFIKSATKGTALCGLNTIINILQEDVPISLMNFCVDKQAQYDKKIQASNPTQVHTKKSGEVNMGNLSLATMERILFALKYKWKRVFTALGDAELNKINELSKTATYIILGYNGLETRKHIALEGHYIGLANGLLMNDKQRKSSYNCNIKEVSVSNLCSMLYRKKTMIHVFEVIKK